MCHRKVNTVTDIILTEFAILRQRVSNLIFRDVMNSKLVKEGVLKNIITEIPEFVTVTQTVSHASKPK